MRWSARCLSQTPHPAPEQSVPLFLSTNQSRSTEDFGLRGEAVERVSELCKTDVMSDSNPNIVFILTDQERYLPELPAGFKLPGRHRLQE